MNDAQLIEDLRLLQKQRIYFGHQSVGSNILQGLAELFFAAGVRLNVVPVHGEGLPEGAVFAESEIGSNGRPQSKCNAFGYNVAAFHSLDIALMKLCYADFNRETDVPRLFEHYRQIVDALKAQHPRVTFVHVTVPVTVRPALWKRITKSLAGRENLGDLENLRRAEFNALLMKHYAGEPIFDLARVESTFPDGARNAFRYAGKTVYSLVPGYSSDGGHLNADGRRRAARELIRILSDVARHRASRQAAVATGGSGRCAE